MDMMTRKRDNTGQYTETVTLDAVLGVFDQVRGPVVTSSDVADVLDCTTEAARQKLARLEDRGEVESRKTGRTKVYWRTESAASPAPSEQVAAERPVTADKSDAKGGGVVGTPGAAEHTSGDDSLPDAVEGAVGAWEPPGNEQKQRARREAIRACLRYLRERGSATPSDFRDDVYPEYPAGYTSGSDPPRSWWKNSTYKGLRHVAEETDALIKADTTGEWMYRR
jgi:hypothetical protein